MFSELRLKPPSKLCEAVAAAVRQLQHVSPQVGGFWVEFGPCDLDFGGILLGGFVKEMAPKNHATVIYVGREQTPPTVENSGELSFSSPRCGCKCYVASFAR